MRYAIPFLLMLLLAACAEGVPGQSGQSGQPDQPDTCGADALRDHLGQPAGTLPPREGRMRVIPPGSAVTMDYAPGRLNVDLDATGTITRLWCG